MTYCHTLSSNGSVDFSVTELLWTAEAAIPNWHRGSDSAEQCSLTVAHTAASNGLVFVVSAVVHSTVICTHMHIADSSSSRANHVVSSEIHRRIQISANVYTIRSFLD